MIEIEADTYFVRIYIAGDVNPAYDIIRRECAKGGMCVTVEKVKYMYCRGEEEGYVVGFINYPRFKEEKHLIFNTAVRLAKTLVNETYQKSATILSPNKTLFISMDDK